MPFRYQFADLYQRSVLQPWGEACDFSLDLLNSDSNPFRDTPLHRVQSAWLESASRLFRHYPARDFGLHEAIDDGTGPVMEEQRVLELPFCDLLHFATGSNGQKPKMLCVAALSGHHATLARETCAVFLPDHEVYVTDWKDARHVPLEAGRFGFEDYVRYLIEFLDFLGPDTHVLAISQAVVPALTATAVLCRRDAQSRPGSLTLLAGPVDVSRGGSLLTSLLEYSNTAIQQAFSVMTVPAGYAGAGRRVYPGLLQLYAFLGFDLHSHVNRQYQFFIDLMNRDEDAARRHRDFYDEFFAVMDVTEEFHLETLERVFFRQDLARGEMQFEGEVVDCAEITGVPLLTVEGSDDDICPPGMTAAAHDLCTGLDPSQKKHHLQPEAGHFGVFSGPDYSRDIAPLIRGFIAASQS